MPDTNVFGVQPQNCISTEMIEWFTQLYFSPGYVLYVFGVNCSLHQLILFNKILHDDEIVGIHAICDSCEGIINTSKNIKAE